MIYIPSVRIIMNRAATARVGSMFVLIFSHMTIVRVFVFAPETKVVTTTSSRLVTNAKSTDDTREERTGELL